MLNELQQMLKIANRDELDNVLDKLQEMSADMYIGNGTPEQPENTNSIEWQIIYECQNIIEKMLDNMNK